jgi:hypothetical protein
MKTKNDRIPWLWAWVGAMFTLLMIAWAVLLTVVVKHPVAEVPLATKPLR